MARKARVEIVGGLNHVLTRGNDRQTIFHSDFRSHQDACRKVISATQPTESSKRTNRSKVQAVQYRRRDPILLSCLAPWLLFRKPILCRNRSQSNGHLSF